MKSKWSLVVHKVSQRQVDIWVGTLFPDLRKPKHCVVEISDKNGALITTKAITRNDWQRPFSQVNDRFYQLLTFTNLTPNTYYNVAFIRLEQCLVNGILEQKTLSKGSFETLPLGLSATKPFVIALGSCFYNEEDNGAASEAYSSLYLSPHSPYKPQVKFFTGDQVYLDIGLDSLSPIVKDVRVRIADEYATTWQTQRQMLRLGANWFLPDDHEYWNNFPYTSGKNPYLWAITALRNIKTAWTQTSGSAVTNVQQTKLFSTFTVGRDLAVCFVDLRSKRDSGNNPQKMLPTKIFEQVTNWAESLTSPGVIVLPQPLLVHPGTALDFNLVNYTKQYQQLITALASSGHDIVCLSGDVHFGRIAQVPLGNNGATLHEIISSPMSNLTGLNGKVAASKPEQLKYFPTIEIKGFNQEKVIYAKDWAVATSKIKFLGVFSYKKTKEHFMTLAFTKNQQQKIKLELQAWRIRELDKSTGLPKKEFQTAHIIELK